MTDRGPKIREKTNAHLVRSCLFLAVTAVLAFCFLPRRRFRWARQYEKGPFDTFTVEHKKVGCDTEYLGMMR